MSATITLQALTAAVTGRAAAIRTRVTLQPAAGEGTKAFPPTCAGSVFHVQQDAASFWELLVLSDHGSFLKHLSAAPLARSNWGAVKK